MWCERCGCSHQDIEPLDHRPSCCRHCHAEQLLAEVATIVGCADWRNGSLILSLLNKIHAHAEPRSVSNVPPPEVDSSGGVVLELEG